MRLKKLILQGFKSFADRTEFVFDAPITGIVGPNGCGKSNVVDAFKWVLGEQSAKSLRGDAMMDVIFNGSSSRKPSGLAEVTLVFENPRREDQSRLLNLDSDEVHVGRRLFRDGTSEYQLNNSSSRLKDIRELFLDTGVGVDAYSVIEQGKVAAMLEANPEERRLIFEEAAGISKYKVKKPEAQRKLEKVDQNLVRLHDIVAEVEKQLRSVKIQAGKARTYQEQTARLNELRLSYSLQEYHTLSQQLVGQEQSRDEAQFRLDDVTADLGRQESELNTAREQLEINSQSRQQAEYQLIQTRAQIQSAQQKQQYAAQQLAQVAEQSAANVAECAAAQARLEETTATLAGDELMLEQMTAQLKAVTREIDEKQQAFRDGQLELNSLNNQVEAAKSRVLELMRQLSAASNRLNGIEIEEKNIAAQQERLASRRGVVSEESSRLLTQRNTANIRLAEVNQLISEQQSLMDARRTVAAELGQQISQMGEQLGAAKEHRSGMMSRQNLLRDLESRREGVSEGVKSVLRQRAERFSFVRGIVADMLRVDVEHAHVIEAALNGQDQTLVTESQELATRAGEPMGELAGRVNFLCVDRLEQANLPAGAYDWNRHPHRIRLAADLVKFEPSDRGIVDHLLGRTIIVDDLNTARELHRAGPAGFRFVTHGGEVIEADGTLRAGPLGAAMSLLSRRSELEAITTQIMEIDARIEQLTAELSHGSAQAKLVEQELNGIRNGIYQLNTEKVELTSQAAQMSDRLNGLGREQSLLDREMENLARQIEPLAQQAAEIAQKKSAMESEQAEHQQRIEVSGQRHAALAEELRGSAEALTAARVTLGQVQEKQLSAQQAVARHRARQGELSQQIQRLERGEEQLRQRGQAAEAELADARHAEESQNGIARELAERLEALTQRVMEMQQSAAALSASVEEISQQHEAIAEELHAVQMKANESRVRLETLVQRTLEESQLDLPAKYAEGYEPAAMDWDAVGEEIRQLRERIARLGNVNLDSINELAALEERSLFYATQLADLTTSKQQLEELITTINQESGIRFEQTFNAVREHFQGMFRKLFGGGKADIYLETELEAPVTALVDGAEAPVVKKIDPLDAGIEIIAKPPGKQPCSISQLSGGEKTMTCVALLMSIFKSKPSPFCILDEVDAALDEANNQRFNLIVQEFLEMSQFIVITHSKRTMQIADILYGVTMQEQGVSKRVAVKFDQVDSQGRISETAAA